MNSFVKGMIFELTKGSSAIEGISQVPAEGGSGPKALRAAQTKIAPTIRTLGTQQVKSPVKLPR